MFLFLIRPLIFTDVYTNHRRVSALFVNITPPQSRQDLSPSPSLADDQSIQMLIITNILTHCLLIDLVQGIALV